MKGLQQEKWDHARTAFLMYENALRRTDKLMDDLAPEHNLKKNAYGSKTSEPIYQMDPIVNLNYEEKPRERKRGASKKSKHKERNASKSIC